jgi:hypothetical protein
MMLLPPVAPAKRPGEAEELLTDLLVVLFGLRGDAWSAVAAAVPFELQQRNRSLPRAVLKTSRNFREHPR